MPEAVRVLLWKHLAGQGRQTQFRAHLIRLLDKRDGELSVEGRKYFLAELYPEWGSLAPALWKTAPPELAQSPRDVGAEDAASDPPLRIDTPFGQGERTVVAPPPAKRERRWSVLERLWRSDRQLITEHPSQPFVESWLKAAVREASPTEETTPSMSSRVIAQIALRMGLRSSALSFAKSSKGRSAIADLAEIYSHERSFENASTLWETAIRNDPWRHDWILQKINALSMIGEQDKAKALEDSRWLRPLALGSSGAAYSTMATMLHQDGLNEQAVEYARAAFSLLETDHESLSAVGRLYATILQELEDYTTSADVQRVRSLLLLTQPNDRAELAQLQYTVSEEFLARAIADLDAGKVESALDHIQRFERVRPAGIEIYEHSYPRLVKNGRQDAADALLERCAERMLTHLEKWPEDATSHNNLAWLFARCDVRLDEALSHAQRAVKLSPEASTFLDTLAEIHFRLGHIDEATELAEKCTALDPRQAHYKKQLQRFCEARRTQMQAAAAEASR